MTRTNKLYVIAALVAATFVAGHILPGLWAPTFALVTGAIAAHIITLGCNTA